MNHWYDLLLISVLFLLLAFVLFKSTRDLAAEGYNRTIALKAIGSALFLFLGGASCLFEFYLHTQQEAIVHKMRTNTIATFAKLPSNWASAVAPADRTKDSISIASMVFTSGGQIGKYLDEKGEWKQYTPSQDDLKQRDQEVDTLARIEEHQFRDLLITGLWWLSGAMAAFLGWFCGSAQRKNGLPSLPTQTHDF